MKNSGIGISIQWKDHSKIKESLTKDTCYLTDEEMKIRNEIIEEKNKAYIEGFGYVAPSKPQTIIVDSDGDINKMVGTME